MYNNFGGFRKQKEDAKKRALEFQRIQAEEQAELERIEQAKVSDESKKIYLIAGAVAVLGAVIIIIKTRKK
tara:strand:+ start:7953 stop:8165 length:213 start_codon:yes stop_codon:yes gene_type:complete